MNKLLAADPLRAIFRAANAKYLNTLHFPSLIPEGTDLGSRKTIVFISREDQQPSNWFSSNNRVTLWIQDWKVPGFITYFCKCKCCSKRKRQESGTTINRGN